MRAIMGKLSGESTLTIAKGTIEGAYADGLGVDVLRHLAPWTEEGNTEMQCLVSRFSIADGMARSEALLFDTSKMMVGGQGSISLATENLDLTLTPRPKEASLMSLAVPLDVGGTLAHPVVTPNRGTIIKGIGAAGMGGLGPIGALLPLASSGGSDNNSCLAALAAPAKKPAPPKKSGGGIHGKVPPLLAN
jgi:uncharacterized protein involved in outer membrane biogenesis